MSNAGVGPVGRTETTEIMATRMGWERSVPPSTSWRVRRARTGIRPSGEVCCDAVLCPIIPPPDYQRDGGGESVVHRVQMTHSRGKPSIELPRTRVRLRGVVRCDDAIVQRPTRREGLATAGSSSGVVLLREDRRDGGRSCPTNASIASDDDRLERSSSFPTTTMCGRGSSSSSSSSSSTSSITSDITSDVAIAEAPRATGSRNSESDGKNDGIRIGNEDDGGDDGVAIETREHANGYDPDELARMETNASSSANDREGGEAAVRAEEEPKRQSAATPGGEG